MTGPDVHRSALVAPFQDGSALPVVPVVTLTDPDDSDAVVAALARHGFRVIEVTLRGPSALRVLQRAVAAGDRVGALVGAGTVCDPQQLRASLRAGSRFAVSPGFDVDLTRQGLASGVPYVPGIATASEAMAARALGARLVKFFPARALGGPDALRALHGPFPDLRFMPTGGIDVGNLGDYLRLPWVLCCGGSWLVGSDDAELAGHAAAVRALLP